MHINVLRTVMNSINFTRRQYIPYDNTDLLDYTGSVCQQLLTVHSCYGSEISL